MWLPTQAVCLSAGPLHNILCVFQAEGTLMFSIWILFFLIPLFCSHFFLDSILFLISLSSFLFIFTALIIFSLLSLYIPSFSVLFFCCSFLILLLIASSCYSCHFFFLLSYIPLLSYSLHILYHVLPHLTLFLHPLLQYYILSCFHFHSFHLPLN